MDAQTRVKEAVTGSFGEFLDDVAYEVGTAGRDGTVELVADAERVAAVAWTLRGVHARDWPGVGAASGNDVVVTGATFVTPGRSDDDADVQLFNLVDWSSVLHQVGALVLDRPLEPDPTSSA